MDKNILVGNGINIVFSRNDDYKNYAIIERLTRYLSTDRYDDVFHGSITSAELLELLNSLNEYFNQMLKGISALKLTQTNDELLTLVDISKRYHSKSNVFSNLLSHFGLRAVSTAVKLLLLKHGEKGVHHGVVVWRSRIGKRLCDLPFLKQLTERMRSILTPLVAVKD